MRWVALFEKEWNTHDKLSYYLAQIAFEVYLCRFMLGGKPSRSFNSFLLDFVTQKPVEDFDLKQYKKEIEESQAAWIGAFSLGAQIAGRELHKEMSKPKSEEQVITRGKPKTRR